MYKYDCRKCPIRNRCIDESANAPSVKEATRRAFAGHIDTLETWAALQPYCLLLKAEQQRARTLPRESVLRRRLRRAREAREQIVKALFTAAGRQPDRLDPDSPVYSLAELRPGQADPDAIPARDADHTPVHGDAAPTERLSPCWLTVVASGRHIALPAGGELVLGRFDPNLGVSPDVDLSYEDRGTHLVSHRHARISAEAGHHTIEDLGGRRGLVINGQQLKPGPRHQLRPGDRIELGSIQLLFERVPAQVLDPHPSANIRHVLIIVPTGRRLGIAPPTDIVIGRSDRLAGFVPDVDLSREGEVAIRVSRRHAMITWRNLVPQLEDLGSGFGTRLTGETLVIGHATPLKAGDHIWLGGCVLAYDIEQ